MSVKVISDNIYSPLGATTAANVDAVRAGRSALRLHNLWQVPEAFMASLFTEEQLPVRTYEAALTESIGRALSPLAVDEAFQQALSQNRVLLVLSTTKGDTTEPNHILLGDSAYRIADHFGIGSMPVTVSNACISGLHAQILAARMLEQGDYDYAIVAGSDIQSRFIVSGFQSFRAVSDEECRPFDEDRFGLNLGEAAATVVLQRCESSVETKEWYLVSSAVRNDAFHISSPSKTGEGAYLALSSLDQEASSLTCISAHGTATLYNDDMESRAIHRAGLDSVLVSGLKGYYGHTMGAAGILETILTLHALDEGWVPGTRGYAANGTACPIRVSSVHEPVSGKTSFVKLMSGFGGCNAAALFSHEPKASAKSQPVANVASHIVVTPDSVTLNGMTMETEGSGRALLLNLFKRNAGDYQKFYKMDLLSRLGFIASELLLQSAEAAASGVSQLSVLLMGRTASCVADARYEKTIQPGSEYFPSPADFVYTLPNIVTGEIAIRHAIHGETLYVALPDRNEVLEQQLIRQALQDIYADLLLAGWIEAEDDEHFLADLTLITKTNK